MGEFDLEYIGSVFLILLVSVILSLIETLMTIGSDFGEFRKMFGKKKLVFWIIVDAVVFGIVDYLEIVLGWRVPLRKVFALLFFLLLRFIAINNAKMQKKKRYDDTFSGVICHYNCRWAVAMCTAGTMVKNESWSSII